MPFGKKPAPAAQPPRPGVLRLFSLDLHQVMWTTPAGHLSTKSRIYRLTCSSFIQAVIADIKDVLHRLFGDKVEVESHTLIATSANANLLVLTLLSQVHDWNVTGYGDPAQFGFKRLEAITAVNLIIIGT